MLFTSIGLARVIILVLVLRHSIGYRSISHETFFSTSSDSSNEKDKNGKFEYCFLFDLQSISLKQTNKANIT